MNQRTFTVDFAEYPFSSQWFDHNGAVMHYVDEGQGVPVVMCHGNPTWSYLYRNIIKALAPECRCIAYDLPGFGFSGHPAGYGYTPMEHAAWVEALLFEHLKLKEFILVVQDWGGPIGLSIASRYPEKVLGVVISSTWVGETTTIGKIFSGLMGTRLGQSMILKRNLFATTLVSMLLGKNASATMLKAYADPFPTPESRKGTAVFPRQIVEATPWLKEIESRMPKLANKPIEFIFGLKDLGTRSADIAKWLRIFPQAEVQKVSGAGHFTQEDCPEAYIVAIRRILNKVKLENQTTADVAL